MIKGVKKENKKSFSKGEPNFFLKKRKQKNQKNPMRGSNPQPPD